LDNGPKKSSLKGPNFPEICFLDPLHYSWLQYLYCLSSAQVFLMHTKGPKKWGLVINLKRLNAMLEDSTKALASWPQWDGEVGSCQEREKFDRNPLNLMFVGADNFYFLLSLINFHKTFGKWSENQILIPDWTYFHCPGSMLARGTGSFKAHLVWQLLPGLEQQLCVRMEELLLASRALFTLTAYGGSFSSFASDLLQAPSQHGGALCSVAGSWGKGITCQGRALSAILEAGDCVPRQPLGPYLAKTEG